MRSKAHMSQQTPEAFEETARAPWLQRLGQGRLVEKLERNLHLGLGTLVQKGVDFVRQSVRSHWALRGVAELGVGVCVRGLGPTIDNAGGVIRIDHDVVFESRVTSTYLGVERGALLTIGEDCFINDGVWLACTQRIAIGRRVLIGPGVRIFDNSYHGTYARRTRPESRAVTIEDDVWLAADCVILPGVTVGRGAIVGTHAVVVHDVPAHTVVAGNPAKVLTQLDTKLFESTLESEMARRAAKRR